MTATIQHLSPASGLPRPTQGRMRPLRAGIRNIWEYDDQQFWFADGRLILRGQNTAGKSKALELLLPFVLDGNIRSERLDPFGSRAKTMYWNLVDFAERASAIGYCWLEFGHLDPTGVERYVTCIVGLRAVRSAGRKVDTWFAVTPQRVGADLEVAPGGVPLTEERFRAALDERSVYSTSARDHRAAVDHALFGLGPDRYGALIHLLLQLRRPKLSEKLDMAHLGEYLSGALPPLERHRMEQLASAFARLDEDTAEIERLEASSSQLQAFLGSYRAHAQVQTRLRADAVRAANTRFDNVTETERRQRAEHDQATESLGAIEGRRAELATAIERMTGQLGGLDLSKVHALHEVEKRAGEAEQHASLLIDRAERDRDDATTAAAGAAEAEQMAEGAAGRRDEAAAAISGLQLTGATAVDFGTTPVTSFTVNGDTSITAVSPPGTAGPVDVTVTNAKGTSIISSQDQFTYQSAGYWTVAADGGIFSYGGAGFYGSMGGTPLNRPIVGMAATPDAKGYWEVASDGGIFAFGDASFFGSTGSLTLNKPIVAMAVTPDGGGYWLVASDGGIFAFGDAQFFGSTGATSIPSPIVSIVAAPTGDGYWEVAASGTIHAFGNPGVYGSAGGTPLNAPIVDAATTSTYNGDWEVGSDGGIFAFGSAPFLGSMGGTPLNKPIVGFAPSNDDGGYWEVASDGGIFAFGDATFYGSMGGQPLNAPMVGLAAA